MTKTIAIANQKGGTGKTTTAVNLGYGLAQEGIKTLIVDLDAQGHVSLSLGMPPEPGLFNLLIAEHPLARVIKQYRTSALWIVPSNKETATAKQIIMARDFREHVLTKALAGADFDVILLDCAPSLDVLHVAALVASDGLLIPVKLDHLGLAGVLEMISSLAEVRRAGYACELLGLLPTFFDRVTAETKAQYDVLAEHFEKRVLPPIPVDTKLREAPSFGRTIWEHAPTSRAVLGLEQNGDRWGGYADLVERIGRLVHG